MLFVAGAGFDPRSIQVATILPEAARKSARAMLLREERPSPAPLLIQRAVENRDRLAKLFPQSKEHIIQVFAQDNAIVGGRASALLMQKEPLDGITDICIDISAMSIGVSFPIIKHFIDVLQDNRLRCNLHVICCDSPAVDVKIKSFPSDAAAPIHGFRGGWGLDDKSHAAILWMPQLTLGKKPILGRIFQVLRNVQPDSVVCPILPFPSSRPRLTDELLEEYADELQSAWSVDVRDLVYADEKSPLDLYRTILRIDEARRRVFESVGGSKIILSPLGSKALSLGALMAAIELVLTILHVESIAYSLDEVQPPMITGADELVHIWLHGDAYANRVKESAAK